MVPHSIFILELVAAACLILAIVHQLVRGRERNAVVHLLFALAVVGSLAGCATYSEVTERHPIFTPIPVGRGELATAESEITHAQRQERSKPISALGEYLDATRTSEQQLHRDPADREAKRDYNFAVGRVLEVIHDARLKPWGKPLTVPGSGGDFVLVAKRDPRPEWNPGLYELTPADQFDFRGKYVTERTVRDGIGAPIVAVGREINKYARTNFAPSRPFYSVTAVARFEGRRCELSFEDPLAAETVTLNGQTFPLAADFKVPLAVMLKQTDPKKFELARLLNPEKYARTAAIERLQPYDPEKTIVLVIHGLMDSQATWTPLINKLRGDPVIRQNYQFWFYSYPSGYPYPYSAAILREELDALEKRFPARKPMIVIGHSMGGCISRLLVIDSGDHLWMSTFGKPPEQVKLSPHVKEYFKEELFFQHRTEIRSVIFIAAPLRGSKLASSWIGRIGAWLIKAPRVAAQASREMLHLTTIQEEELKPKRRSNSVDTLSPKSRFGRAVNTLPIAPDVTYHTIIGDRGRGDSPDSSDGFVEYWSSHMDGADSEFIAPCNHSAHQDPEAIGEVLRILKLYTPSR